MRKEEFLSSSPEETIKIARSFSEKLKGGELVSLTGPLGSGKTVFVKGIASGLGISEEEVSSPSFTVVNVYPGRLTLYHVDLYRVKGDPELEAELWEILDYESVVVIEWAENLESIMKESEWIVKLEKIDEKRKITIFRRG